MRIKILIFVFSIVLLNSSFGQKKEKFKTGVKLIENSFPVEYKKPKSILFVFDVIGCQANFYNDLAKNLKRRFKRSKTKVLFNFNIKTKIEVEKLSKKVHSKEASELLCYVTTSDFKYWDNYFIEKRKQNYNLNLLFKNSKTNEEIGTLKMNINSYRTIVTQNKNSSKRIYQLITE